MTNDSNVIFTVQVKNNNVQGTCFFGGRGESLILRHTPTIFIFKYKHIIL